MKNEQGCKQKKWKWSKLKLGFQTNVIFVGGQGWKQGDWYERVWWALGSHQVLHLNSQIRFIERRKLFTWIVYKTTFLQWREKFHRWNALEMCSGVHCSLNTCLRNFTQTVKSFFLFFLRVRLHKITLNCLKINSYGSHIISSTRGGGEAEQKIREDFLKMDADK